jgi:histidine triad (HIT) family protein
MNAKTIFQKIIDKEIPSTIIYEDDLCIIIEDISPQAPIHYLAIPKKVIIGISDLDDTDDKNILGHLMIAIKNQMKKMRLKDYRLVINNGSEAGQTVFHLHIHILANRTLGWPPG